MVEELFLEKEHAKVNMKDVNVIQFSFKRRLGLLTMSSKGDQTSAQVSLEIRELDQPKTAVERLTKSVMVVNHRKV